VVGKVSPTFTTTASPSTGTVGTNGTFGDTATITGGYNPTGSVTFTLTVMTLVQQLPGYPAAARSVVVRHHTQVPGRRQQLKLITGVHPILATPTIMTTPRPATLPMNAS